MLLDFRKVVGHAYLYLPQQFLLSNKHILSMDLKLCINGSEYYENDSTDLI